MKIIHVHVWPEDIRKLLGLDDMVNITPIPRIEGGMEFLVIANDDEPGLEKLCNGHRLALSDIAQLGEWLAPTVQPGETTA